MDQNFFINIHSIYLSITLILLELLAIYLPSPIETALTLPINSPYTAPLSGLGGCLRAVYTLFDGEMVRILL